MGKCSTVTLSRGIALASTIASIRTAAATARVSVLVMPMRRRRIARSRRGRIGPVRRFRLGLFLAVAAGVEADLDRVILFGVIAGQAR